MTESFYERLQEDIKETIDIILGSKDGSMESSDSLFVNNLIHSLLLQYEIVYYRHLFPVHGITFCKFGLRCSYMIAFNIILSLLFDNVYHEDNSCSCGCNFLHGRQHREEFAEHFDFRYLRETHFLQNLEMLYNKYKDKRTKKVTFILSTSRQRDESKAETMHLLIFTKNE